ncbi:MAG: hypothetical protein KIT87_30270, partial [Anaerolineae bacterium]|nr:hypothetical protein [Anaerolineae bacterium]
MHWWWLALCGLLTLTLGACQIGSWIPPAGPLSSPTVPPSATAAPTPPPPVSASPIASRPPTTSAPRPTGAYQIFLPQMNRRDAGSIVRATVIALARATQTPLQTATPPRRPTRTPDPTRTLRATHTP